ncbi:MAG: hypothetical protein ABIL17_08510 [candidate division WOR-3 bacterium]
MNNLRKALDEGKGLGVSEEVRQRLNEIVPIIIADKMLAYIYRDDPDPDIEDDGDICPYCGMPDCWDPECDGFDDFIDDDDFDFWDWDDEEGEENQEPPKDIPF